MDPLELPDAHVGIDLGGGQAGVSEHLLDAADVGPVAGLPVSCGPTGISATRVNILPLGSGRATGTTGG